MTDRSWYGPLLLAVLACAPRGPAPTIPTQGLAPAESAFADLRELRDRYEVSTAAGRAATPEGLPLADLSARHDSLRVRVSAALAGIDSAGLGGEDRRALAAMRKALAAELTPLATGAATEAPGPPDCAYDPPRLAPGPAEVETLRARLYACYGWAQSHVALKTDTLDRLTVLGMLGRAEDGERRRELFLALEPVWRSMNGANDTASPYRRLIALEAEGRKGDLPSAAQARRSGLPPDSLEPWLLAILSAWRDGLPDSLVEPWDWYYENGRASRALSGRIGLEQLGDINRRVYRSLGADLDSIGVRYDLSPREGKTPVAFCTFGRRARFRGGRWTGAEPWVFATYRTGGLDNLNELLHETGHAVHIAAIRARPALADWPDSDPFTEAVAEFVALDAYEPAWQRRWLGDSVPRDDGLRARYGGIVLDMAWALLELRMQRDPTADPNRIWADLTGNYLRIRPHPELSWWAMRGQLVDAPGYMMNYAAGAIIIAALRARTRDLHGSFSEGDPSWYAWVAPRLFRFGLERPTREVLDEFLGGPLSPAALLADLRRMGGPA
ncbi:MAG TPA: hypothetical protein VEB59_16595 [Gemmatimonadales bacterium]|nr:hypothetical protein [Gemmatimonadales bacterium]